MGRVQTGDIGSLDLLGAYPAEQSRAEVAQQGMVGDGLKGFGFSVECLVLAEKGDPENGLDILEGVTEDFAGLRLWQPDAVVLSVQRAEGDVFL